MKFLRLTVIGVGLMLMISVMQSDAIGQTKKVAVKKRAVPEIGAAAGAGALALLVGGTAVLTGFKKRKKN